MIPKSCKRLAEVDFPIAEVSRHAVREKSIRHGHPSTLHLWWARRPLASCRAVLMALLLPDPCDGSCPAAFKETARRVLLRHEGRPRGWDQTIGTDDGLGRILLKFIADFANWDVAANAAYLKTSRALVKAAHGAEPPLVVDPFAGGGSIPLEALRVGCEAFAPIGEWADVLRELPKRVSDWMRRLQGEGVRGADLVFACVGPALEIYSRYRAVETVDGRTVALAEYLERVWEVVGRTALQEVLGTASAGADAPLQGALEEDARLTALFLWTLQSTETAADDEPDEEAVARTAAKGFSLPFDVVRRFSQPMGIDLDAWTGRIVAQAKGAVRLLPVAERARALFGEDGAASAADWIESDANPSRQLSLFPDGERGPRRPRARSILNSDAELQTQGATTLDRLHAAMLLQASGHAGALRALIHAEQERGPTFLRLANALTALYPRGSQEKRLLDAMLLAVPK